MQLQAALVTLAMLMATATAQSSSASASSASSAFADIPLCDQDELIEVSDIMTTYPRKLQCQEVLNVTEMVTISDPLELCAVTSCVAALQYLYSYLPQCRYKDWPIQYECELLLKNCGITPTNVSSTDSSFSDSSVSGSIDDGSNEVTKTPSWNASSSDGSFAPVGETPTPTTEAPTSSSSGSTSTDAAAKETLSLVFAVATTVVGAMLL